MFPVRRYCNLLLFESLISRRTFCSTSSSSNSSNDSIRRLKILGIETSCDDTGAAVVSGSGSVLGEAIHSQRTLHNLLGGITPPYAQRQHRAHIEHVVDDAMQRAGIRYEDLDAIAVTRRPGMVVCLQVGVSHALKLARRYAKPLISVHHMRAHALTVRAGDPSVQFPFLCLLVSGGHCILTLVRGVSDFLVLGQTIDSAPGDILDKIARRLRLKYYRPELANVSGGRAIEIVASMGGNPLAIPFAAPKQQQDCDFSFCGVRSLADHHLNKLEAEQGICGTKFLNNLEDFCASFQHSVFRHIAKRVQRAIEILDQKEMVPPLPSGHYGAMGDGLSEKRTLVISGGVGCNEYLRRGLGHVARHYGYRLVCPPTKWCEDNGVMIAWNGLEIYRNYLNGEHYDEEILQPAQFPVEDELWLDSKAPIGVDFRREIERMAWKVQERSVKLDDTARFISSSR